MCSERRLVWQWQWHALELGGPTRCREADVGPVFEISGSFSSGVRMDVWAWWLCGQEDVGPEPVLVVSPRVAWSWAVGPESVHHVQVTGCSCSPAFLEAVM